LYIIISFTALTLYVKPGAVLDFEIISDKYFSVTFTVTDNIDSVNVSTSINIQDENDPPVFVMSTFYVWTNESQVGFVYASYDSCKNKRQRTPKGVIKNGTSRETGNIAYTRRRKIKQKHNTCRT
jgi:hypothetical protein